MARDLLAALKALPRVERLAYLTIEPTDVVVIEVRHPLTPQQQDAIKQHLHTIWPKNRSLVLTGGMTLKIGTERNGNGAAADDDEMAHPATVRLLQKAGADVELADVTGWTKAQRIEARTWALQTIDAHEHDAPGKHTSVRWPDHVSRAHRRKTTTTTPTRGKART